MNLLCLSLLCVVLSFNLSWQLSPTQRLAHFPSPISPIGMGERIGRVKVRKLVCWDKGSLMGRVKATHEAKQNKEFLYHFPLSGRSFGVSCPHCVLSQVLTGWGVENALALGNQGSAITKTSLNCQHVFSSTNPKRSPYQLCEKN